MRLRPYGNDGALTSTLSALDEYYKNHAQPWEIQAFTWARHIGGNQELGNSFKAFKKLLLYNNSASRDTLDYIWEMRKKIQNLKAAPENPILGFKTTEGGLLDNEFLAQAIQLALGYRHPELQTQNTLEILEAAHQLKILPETEITQNLNCFQKLLQIELVLRLDTYTPTSRIPQDTEAQRRLALWLGLPPKNDFFKYYTQVLAKNNESTQKLKESLES